MTLRLRAATAICTTALVSAAAASTFSAYIALGDSLSDDGKGLTSLLPPPYVGGRFSNGRVWTEFVADDFQAQGLPTLNLALGGATAGDENDNAPTYPAALAGLGTLDLQIGALSASLPSLDLGNNPLVSILFGGNDLLQRRDPVRAALDTLDGIRQIADLAPELDSFLVASLPDLGTIPAGTGNPLATPASLAFNAVLETGLTALEDGLGLEILRLDQAGFVAGLAAIPGALGITNFTDPCFVPPDAAGPGVNCTFTGLDADGNPIFDPELANEFFFIDGVHPNTLVHAAFADAARAAIGGTDMAAVPLPAGLPLVLTGFVAFALFGRRKAAGAA